MQLPMERENYDRRFCWLLLEDGVSPFEYLLRETISKIQRDTGMPARTVALSTRLNIPERTVRYWLVRAEENGAICRKGLRGGWLPAMAAA